MNEVRSKVCDGSVMIYLSGHIDSNNAAAAEEAFREAVSEAPGAPVVIDAEELEYISSAGLRAILHLRKTSPDMRITQVRPEVYEIFDMTGFTQMMTIEKAYRSVSIDGCEVIGRGANGTIYRIDQDTVVKAYNNADALEDIQHEREVARLALVLGIPTAISYDVVRVGESYGSVFELLNARSFAKILAEEPEKMDWCVAEYVEMLKKIHGTLVPPGDLPDLRETAIGWAKFMQDYLPKEKGEKLLSLIEAVPRDDHMIHGDYHTKNIVLQENEVLLIDMDTLSVGHPIFELASMYNAFLGFSELDPEIIKEFQGFTHEVATEFWKKVLAAYLGTEDEDAVRAVEDKARVVGYTRMIRRSIRRKGLEDPTEKEKIEHWKAELLDLLDRVDSLTFLCNEIELEAKSDNLAKVLAFVDSHLEEAGCPMKTQMQIDVAVEEIFVNVATYAYAPGDGTVRICIKRQKDPASVTITFTDRGVPYDPLKKEDPDITLSAEERSIGGLGIFMVKQTMDDMFYEYKDGQNILTMTKKLDGTKD